MRVTPWIMVQVVAILTKAGMLDIIISIKNIVMPEPSVKSTDVENFLALITGFDRREVIQSG